MDEQTPQKPAEQAKSPISGTVPPEHTRFKPGQSGNPAGRPTAGMSIREWINTLASGEATEAEIKRIARGKDEPWPKRAAAERILRTIESGDLADFEGFNTLAEAKAQGLNTEVVKKLKTRSRVVPKGDDSFEEIIEREIELHDRSGQDFDRVMDRTDGKPSQSIQLDATVEQNGKHTVVTAIVNDPATLELALELERRLCESGGAGVVPDSE